MAAGAWTPQVQGAYQLHSLGSFDLEVKAAFLLLKMAVLWGMARVMPVLSSITSTAGSSAGSGRSAPAAPAEPPEEVRWVDPTHPE